MSMIKRLQVPVTEIEDELFKKAARIYSISAAEWARRVLRKAAERDISADVVMDPLEAVRAIGKLNASVDSVSTMKEQSVRGRLR